MNALFSARQRACACWRSGSTGIDSRSGAFGLIAGFPILPLPTQPFYSRAAICCSSRPTSPAFCGLSAASLARQRRISSARGRGFRGAGRLDFRAFRAGAGGSSGRRRRRGGGGIGARRARSRRRRCRSWGRPARRGSARGTCRGGAGGLGVDLAAGVFEHPGEPEIGQLDPFAFVAPQEVRRFEVAVHQPLSWAWPSAAQICWPMITTPFKVSGRSCSMRSSGLPRTSSITTKKPFSSRPAS